jgi:hypothetical protein
MSLNHSSSPLTASPSVISPLPHPTSAVSLLAHLPYPAPRHRPSHSRTPSAASHRAQEQVDTNLWGQVLDSSSISLPCDSAFHNSKTGSATPSSSAQAQHTPRQEAQVEGTDDVHVLIDDDVPVGRKRKLKSDVWLEFEDVIVGGKKKLNASGVKSF